MGSYAFLNIQLVEVNEGGFMMRSKSCGVSAFALLVLIAAFAATPSYAKAFPWCTTSEAEVGCQRILASLGSWLRDATATCIPRRPVEGQIAPARYLKFRPRDSSEFDTAFAQPGAAPAFL